MEYDLVKKRYLSDNERYADLINGLLFKGRQLIRAENLMDMDTQTGMWSRIWRKGKWKYKLQYRDLIKKMALGVGFVVVGIENQEEVHYLMPLRSMAYDVAEYERQAVQVQKKVKKRKGISRAEFLSGFGKEDVLTPCVTLVLYYGDNWNGSRDLHGILDMKGIPEEMKAYINNYSLHLIEVRKLQNTEVFQTDIKQVFDFIRYSDDKKKLKELIHNNSAYEEMDEDAYDMAVAYADAEELIGMKKYRGKDGKVNMCKGLQEWIEDERNEGRSEGRSEKQNQIIKNMLLRGMPDEDICALAECNQELVEEIRTQL